MNDRAGLPYGKALAAAALAALAAAVSLILVYAASPAFWPPLRLMPSLGSGFYPVEHNDAGAFAWIGGGASIRLDGLDRRVAWACDVRVRAGRPDAESLPLLTVAADNRILTSARVNNASHHVAFTIPVQQDRRGVIVTLMPSGTFTPATGDRRALGLVVEDFACQPAAGIPLPPRRTLGRASLAGAILGAGFGLLQTTPGTAVGAAVAVAALQAIPLALGTAPYLGLPAAAAWLALVASMLLVGGVALAQRLRRAPLRNTARFVTAFSVAAFYLKLLVLLHPETAPAAPDATALPALLDHRALDVLRVALDATVGLSLYWVGCKLLGDRLAASAGVVLYHLSPGSFGPWPASPSMALAAPLVVLAVAGAVRLASWEHTRGVLLVLVAWGSAGIVVSTWLVGPGAVHPLTADAPMALAAAAGASWGWSLGRFGPRLATSVVLSGALWAGAVSWLSRL